MTYFQQLVASTLTFVSSSAAFPGMIHVRGTAPAIVAAFVLSILNILVKPVLTIPSLPFTLLTFGLFNFVVDATVLRMIPLFAGGMNFGFSSSWTVMLMAAVMSIVNTIITDYNLSKYR